MRDLVNIFLSRHELPKFFSLKRLPSKGFVEEDRHNMSFAVNGILKKEFSVNH